MERRWQILASSQTYLEMKFSVKDRNPSSLALISNVYVCSVVIFLNDDISQCTFILVEYAIKRILVCLIIESQRIWSDFARKRERR